MMDTATMMTAVEEGELAPTPLDEASLRRPDFRPGEAVTLADGQAWQIPCPRLAFLPTIGPDGKFATETRSTFGPDFDRKIDALRGAGTVAAEAVALLEVAVDLIGRNYDIRPDRYRELVRYETGPGEVNQPLWAIYRIATGYGVVGDSAGAH